MIFIEYSGPRIDVFLYEQLLMYPHIPHALTPIVCPQRSDLVFSGHNVENISALKAFIT